MGQSFLVLLYWRRSIALITTLVVLRHVVKQATDTIAKVSLKNYIYSLSLRRYVRISKKGYVPLFSENIIKYNIWVFPLADKVFILLRQTGPSFRKFESRFHVLQP